MPDKGWKQFERRCAKAVGTTRIPVTGERDGADAMDGMFAYQFKLGRRFPAYLDEWLRGIVASGGRHGRVGVVVWKPKGVRDENAVVVMRFKDFRDLHGGAHGNASGDD